MSSALVESLWKPAVSNKASSKRAPFSTIDLNLSQNATHSRTREWIEEHPVAALPSQEGASKAPADSRPRVKNHIQRLQALKRAKLELKAGDNIAAQKLKETVKAIHRERAEKARKRAEAKARNDQKGLELKRARQARKSARRRERREEQLAQATMV